MSAPVWRPILEITRRELGAWSRSRWGWGLVSGALLLEGLLFNSFALGQTPRYSQQVLADLLYLAFGVHAVLAILVTMRAFPEERQRGTWALLAGSPARAWQIVAGKFAAAAALLLATGLGSLYLPALILVEGHITPGHLAVGYGGVWLASSAVAALGIFGAAAARTQLGAAALTSALLVGLLTSWLLAQITAPPLDAALAQASFFDAHFRGFMQGRLRLQDVVYYVSVGGTALVAATQLVAARRWT